MSSTAVTERDPIVGEPRRAGSATPAGLLALIKLCRPHQWAKNVFVLAPLLFAGALLDLARWQSALIALGCFCLISSAVYIFNDLLDIEADRHHPRKRNRPLAAGTVGIGSAIALAVTLLGLAGVAASFLLPWRFLAVAGLYLANSLLYCLWLKHKVLVDVMVIAAGFVLRLLAGCVAISVVPSGWIVVCGFSLALVLGFGKRRTELARLGSNANYRTSLKSYDVPKVDTLLAICTSVSLLAYMLYTLAGETVQRHQTQNLVYTVPFVAYGLFRFLLIVQSGKGDGPTEILLKDRAFYATGLLWALSVAIVLYAL